MRDLHLLDAYRMTDKATVDYFGSAGDSTCGCFQIPSVIDKASLLIIASSGEGWEHVSVSRNNRAPNWPEMSQIKRTFFRGDEWVVQFHPAEQDYVNCHPYCLHLWRPIDGVFPRPPSILVGPH